LTEPDYGPGRDPPGPTDILSIAADAREAAGEAVPSARSSTDPGTWLIELARRLRDAPGVRRKAPIQAIVMGALPEPERLAPPDLLTAWKGEDAAALDLGILTRMATGGTTGAHGDAGPVDALPGARGHLLVATDGIRSDLIERDPYWAGFCSVIVNVNDILAMGGRPLALVQVLSFTEPEQGQALTRGIAAASTAYGVPVVGGHTHPPVEGSEPEAHESRDDEEENGPEAESGSEVEVEANGVADPILRQDHLSVTALGVVGPEMLRSDGARAGDALVVAVDLRGDFRTSSTDDEYKKKEHMGGGAFDTIAERSAHELQRLCELPPQAAREGLATACKDISNPGLVGTLGMLCETSGVGALLELEGVPCPSGVNGLPTPTDGNLEAGDEKIEMKGGDGPRRHGYLDWLLAYPGYGFIFATAPDRADELCRLFEREGVTAAACGRFTPLRRLQVSLGDQRALVWDFGAGDTITGLGP